MQSTPQDELVEELIVLLNDEREHLRAAIGEWRTARIERLTWEAFRRLHPASAAPVRCAPPATVN